MRVYGSLCLQLYGIELLVVSGAELGFKNDASYKDICARAIEMGLRPDSREVFGVLTRAPGAVNDELHRYIQAAIKAYDGNVVFEVTNMLVLDEPKEDEGLIGQVLRELTARNIRPPMQLHNGNIDRLWPPSTHFFFTRHWH